MNDVQPQLVLETTPLDVSAPAPAPRHLFFTLTDEDWRRTLAVIRAREKRVRDAENERFNRPFRRH